jgi:hypothetical protein
MVPNAERGAPGFSLETVGIELVFHRAARMCGRVARLLKCRKLRTPDTLGAGLCALAIQQLTAPQALPLFRLGREQSTVRLPASIVPSHLANVNSLLVHEGQKAT